MSSHASRLLTLKQVHDEVGAIQPRSDEIALLELPAGRKMIEERAPKKSAEIIEDLFLYATNPLFVFEALSRREETNLAKECFEVWQKRYYKELETTLNDAMPKKDKASPGFHFGPSSGSFDLGDLLGSLQTQTASLETKHIIKASDALEAYCAAIQAPKFASSERFQAVLKGVKAIGKEALFHAKNAPPKTDEDRQAIIKEALKFTLAPNLEQHVLLQRYKNDITSFNAGEAYGTYIRDDVSDTAVQTLFSLAPNLLDADFTDCIGLTPSAFSEGHPRLLKLVLTGTSVDPFDIDRSRFPETLEVINDRKVTAFNLDSLRDEKSLRTPTDWQDLTSKLQSADVIIFGDHMNNNGGYDVIFSRFRANPTVDGLEALLELQASQKKFSKTIYSQPTLDEKAAQLLIDFWKREETFEEGSFGWALTATLLRLWRVSLNEKASSLIWQAVSEDLVNQMQREITKPGAYRSTLETFNSCSVDRDFRRVHSFLKQLRDRPSKEDRESLLPNIHEALTRQLRALLNEAFKNGVVYPFHKEMRPKEVRTVELTAAILVEFSQISPGLNDASQTILSDAMNRLLTKPASREVREGGIFSPTTTVVEAGPLYFLPLDYSIAAAFAIKLEKQADRVALLERVLKDFDTHMSDEYPLAKLVVGSMKEEDIPKRNKDQAMNHWLINYPGVFAEDVPVTLKESYLKALLEGKLGGKTVALIEALVDLYQNEKTDESTRRKIRICLREATGSAEFNQAVKDASKKLNII